MLSAADAALVRRDVALVGLGTLLDPEALLSALVTAPGIQAPTGARITYIRYKRATNCVVGYEFEVNRMPVIAYAKARLPRDADAVQKAWVRRTVSGPFGPGRVVLDVSAITVVVFPNDDKLKALTRLADSDGRVRLLRSLAGVPRVLARGALMRTLGYKPERRFVGEVSVAGRRLAALKFYAEQGYRAAARAASAIASRGALRIAPLLGQSDEQHVLGFGWLEGALLSDVLREPLPQRSALATVGAALAELHGQTPAGLRPHSQSRDLAALWAAVDSVVVVCPHLARLVQPLARNLADHVAAAAVERCPIHGDFYARQVVVGENSAGLLDLDRAYWGDPASDLGTFCAHLERDVLSGRLTRERAGFAREALLEGYGASGRHPSRRTLKAQTVARLLRLAPEPFRRHGPNWPEETEAIVERAAAIWEEGGSRQLTSVDVPRPRHTARAEPSTPVADSFGAADDPQMPFLARALDASEAERVLSEAMLSGFAGARLHVHALRVVRHKAGRRCLIEYDLVVERPGAEPESLTLTAKVRARGADTRTYRVQRALWRAGFDSHSADGLSVPEPLGVVRDLHMCLQRKVPGVSATRHLTAPGATALLARIAEAAHKLHQSGVPTSRRHTIDDELRILQERLRFVAQTRPEWTQRLDRVLSACVRLAAALQQPVPRGIHRDFYADQLLVDGDRLYLLDLDLYSLGDPALDIGNFAAHLIEQGLREFDDPDTLGSCATALQDRFVELTGGTTRHATHAYTTLALVRHIHLSTQFADRRHCTEAVLDLCEKRLGIPTKSRVTSHISIGQ